MQFLRENCRFWRLPTGGRGQRKARLSTGIRRNWTWLLIIIFRYAQNSIYRSRIHCVVNRRVQVVEHIADFRDCQASAGSLNVIRILIGQQHHQPVGLRPHSSSRVGKAIPVDAIGTVETPLIGDIMRCSINSTKHRNFIKMAAASPLCSLPAVGITRITSDGSKVDWKSVFDRTCCSRTLANVWAVAKSYSKRLNPCTWSDAWLTLIDQFCALSQFEKVNMSA